MLRAYFFDLTRILHSSTVYFYIITIYLYKQECDEMLIYIVEDEANIRELESYALEKNGFEVQCFENSGDFYDSIKVRTPDLILLDVMLPGDDGKILRVSIQADSIFALFERSLVIILIIIIGIIIVSLITSVQL